MTSAIYQFALTLGVFLFVSCSSPTSDEIEAEFEKALLETRDCQIDSDCSVIYPGCPLGCFVAVHQLDRDQLSNRAQELIRSYESGGESCIYDCASHLPPTCQEKRCVVEPDF